MIDLNKRHIINYLLLPIAAIFYLLSLIRKTCYRIGLFPVQHFDVPVIVVGNITVGGNGKTPMVIALANHFKRQGKKVGVVSRGYGGKLRSPESQLLDESSSVAEVGDEPWLIATQTQAKVMVNKNRAQAVRDLIDCCKVDLVISDDGLQHYAMGRTIEIVLLGQQRRFGNGFFLPAGPLREPKSRLNSVDFVVNNGGEITLNLVPKAFINMATSQSQPLDFFQGQTCYGVAGIAHPQRFFNTLADLGVVVKPHAFADHFAYQKNDLAFIHDYPIIMTAKDWVKCTHFSTEQMWYLQVEADLDDNFLNQLQAKL